MQLLTLVLFLTSTLFILTSCSKDGGSNGGGAAASGSGAAAGTLAVVTGELQPAEGADPSTVAGALVQAEAHPEVSAVTDEAGKFTIENVLPGTVALYVGSNDGAAGLLEGKTIGPTAYGLKLPDVVLISGEVTDLGQQALKKSGGISGKVTFYSNPNSLDLTGSDVFVPGTGFIAKTDADGAFSLSGLPPGLYQIRAQHTGFAVLDIKDLEILEDQTTNIGDVALSISTGPEGSITVDHDLTAAIGDNSAVKIVKARTVTVNLKYDSDSALMKVADEPSFTNKEWQAVEASMTWTFSSDGTKTLYVMYSDLNGLESSPFKDEFIVDSEAPISPTISILNGWDQIAATSTSMRVNVSADDTGSGVAKMMICTTNNFEGCGSWVDFASEAAGVAVSANVYVKFKDYAGHLSAVATDSIVLGSHSIISGGTYAGDLRLYEAQKPFHFEGTITVNGNLTIDPGVSLENANNGNFNVKGRLKAIGTAAKKITLTGAAFGGFDLSDSPFDDNEIRYFDTDHVLMTAPFVKINGGVLAENEIDESNTGVVFVQKSGYKPLKIEKNVLTKVKISIVSGNSTTIIRNDINSDSCPAIIQDGGNGTIISYNTIALSCDGSGSANNTHAIYSNDGDLSFSFNSIDLNGDSGMFGALSNAVAIDMDGAVTLTASHNNINIDNSGEPSQVVHFAAGSGTVSADENYYTKAGALVALIISANASTNTNVQATAWPTTGVGCVGATCP